MLGANAWGQLGDGTNTERDTPVDVSGLTSGVAAIVAGGVHTCALMDAVHGGGVKCWGLGIEGQIGNGALLEGSIPGDVVGLMEGGKAIAAGYYHTCAVTASGGAKCWGENRSGQLGDGANINRSIPTDVSGLASDVLSIASGSTSEHSCALMASGGVKCWGQNVRGQLGDGTQIDRNVPVDVVGLTGGVESIAVGGVHSCGLTTQGGVKCWGWNYSGQLGDGTQIDHDTPADVVGLTSGVQAIAAGASHTCALMVNGEVRCWGSNYWGELGIGHAGNSVVPVVVSGLGGRLGL